jgi:hypothetical protein
MIATLSLFHNKRGLSYWYLGKPTIPHAHSDWRGRRCVQQPKGGAINPDSLFFFAGEDWWNIRGVIVGDTLSHKNQQLRFGFYVCGRDLFGV